MFSKAVKPEKTSDAALSAAAGERKAPKPASLISQDLTLEGGVVGEGELHVDGVIRGDVRVGRLTLGDTGHIEGSVQAESIDIRGRIIGTVTAKQVRLFGTAYVDGDITAEQLSIDIGAYFQGRVLQSRREAPAPVAPAPRPVAAAPAPAASEFDAPAAPAPAEPAPQVIDLKSV